MSIATTNTAADFSPFPIRRLYACAGIRSYWIVNLVDRKVEVYSDPILADGEPRYSVTSNFAVGDELPVTISGQEVGRVTIAELFPNAN
jgi:Uma2 family endonuclease